MEDDYYKVIKKVERKCINKQIIDPIAYLNLIIEKGKLSI